MKLPSLPKGRRYEQELLEDIHQQIMDIRELRKELAESDEPEQVQRHLKSANLVLERLYQKAVRG